MPKLGLIEADLGALMLRTQGGDLPLTALEAKLLSFLFAQRGRTISREELLQSVWGYSHRSRSRAVDHTVARLRKKLEADPASPQWLVSVRGGGYRLEAEPQATQAESEPQAHLSTFDLLDPTGTGTISIVSCGLAIPALDALPLAGIVSSYRYDLLPDGRWMHPSDRAMLRIEVTARGVSLSAMVPRIWVRDRTLDLSEPISCEDGDVIVTALGEMTFRTLPPPYAGLLLVETGHEFALAQGSVAEIGRDPLRPGLVLPERHGQDNLSWCAGDLASHAQQQGFTLDRALVSRRHARISALDEEIYLEPLQHRCPTWLSRGNTLILDRVEGRVGLTAEDQLLIGTAVVCLRAQHPSG